MKKEKCVLIVDDTMPLGAIANTVAVLSVSLGKLRPEIVGESLIDSDGYTHQGITTLAIPILRGNGPLLKHLRNRAREFEPDLLIVDLIGATKSTKSYEEYAEVLRRGPADAIEYIGLGLFGDKTTVSSLTGSLGLLR